MFDNNIKNSLNFFLNNAIPKTFYHYPPIYKLVRQDFHTFVNICQRGLFEENNKKQICQHKKTGLKPKKLSKIRKSRQIRGNIRSDRH